MKSKMHTALADDGARASSSGHRTSGLRLVKFLAVLTLMAFPLNSAPQAVAPPVNVTTYHNDNTRQGLNSNEIQLTASNVNAAQFGKLFSHPIDGYVYAQVLYLPNVNIPGDGPHNVAYVATEHDSVYAFDADSKNGSDQPLWKTSFIDLARGITPVSSFKDMVCADLVPEIGITGTPVIDATTGTLYVVANTKENGKFFQRLHALDVATGAEKFGGPVEIQAKVRGVGSGSVNGYVYFDPLKNNQRAGLLLNKGSIYIAWASHCDLGPYHGWIISYDSHTLARNGVWNSTPDWGLGGIWQAGGGLAADEEGRVFAATGNGGFDADRGGRDYGESVLKFGSPQQGKLPLLDYFTPHDQFYLNVNDLDVGSGGPMLLPTQPVGAPHRHLLTLVGKEGVVYLVDRDHMGHFNPKNDDQIVQSFSGVIAPTGGISTWWHNTLYYVPVGDNLKALHFDPNSGLISTSPESQTLQVFGFPPPLPSASSNGDHDGIIWAVQTDGYYYHTPAILHAYDASNLANELYNSSQDLARDNPGPAGKFTVPTIANGKVYVTAHKQFSVYGLLP